jgi:DNA-binding PadR family transcriptional regulator
MGPERVGELAASMQSPVNWALLGLVIERPSYAYELAQRFDRAYDGVLSLSSTSHVYTAIGALKSRGMIDEIPGTRGGRQPKPRYRATAHGIENYRSWLVAQIHEDRRRQRLLVLQLAAFGRNPEVGLEIVERCQRACLEEACRIPIPGREETRADADSDRGTAGPDRETGADPSLTKRLLSEENRLAVGAKLAWIEYARHELRALADARAAQR